MYFLIFILNIAALGILTGSQHRLADRQTRQFCLHQSTLLDVYFENDTI